jgi:hypothetical protein
VQQRTRAPRNRSVFMLKPALVVLTGLALGVGASAADSFQGFGPDARPWVRVVSIALNMVVAWVGAAFLAGRVSKTVRGAVVAGVLVLYVAVLGYYLFGAFFGDRMQVGSTTLTSASLRWLIAATVAGPVFGLLGYLGRRRTWVGILATLSLPVVAVLEVFVRLRISLDGFRFDPLREWTAVVVLVATILAAAWSLALSRKVAGEGDERASARSRRAPT